MFLFLAASVARRALVVTFIRRGYFSNCYVTSFNNFSPMSVLRNGLKAKKIR